MAALTALDIYYQAEAEYRRALLLQAAGEHRLKRELRGRRQSRGPDFGWTKLDRATRPKGCGPQIGNGAEREPWRHLRLFRGFVASLGARVLQRS